MIIFNNKELYNVNKNEIFIQTLNLIYLNSINYSFLFLYILLTKNKKLFY